MMVTDELIDDTVTLSRYMSCVDPHESKWGGLPPFYDEWNKKLGPGRLKSNRSFGPLSSLYILGLL